MGRTIAIANQKGGVGKSTTAINLSSCLGEMGQKVLTIDMDPQGNTTSGLGLDKNDVPLTIYDVFLGEATIAEVKQPTCMDGLEVIPTSTTFFLVRLKKGTAADLKQFLLDNYGILIRDASNFRGLDETYLRLSTQKSDENQILLEGVKVWLEQQ